jgi:hypothetical protein
MSSERARFAQHLLNQHFVGDAFRDELFETDNNDREKACAWKIQSSSILVSPLATGRVRIWNAVGIPFELVDIEAQGDFDLMFALDPYPVKAETIYRSFELKTSKVGRDGKVTSLKTGKFHKTIGQLEKLCEIGASQVYLLEVFIVEAGFSRTHNTMPDSARESIEQKRHLIRGADFGYVVAAIEQIPGYDVQKAGMLWPTTEIQSAKLKPPLAPFTDVVQRIRDFNTAKRAFRKVITYCQKCRDLTAANPAGPYVCETCGTSLIS